LGGSQDLTVLENFVYGDTPEPAAIKQILTDLSREEESFSLSLYQMSQAYDIRTLVISTLLTYLELEKILSATGPFYTSYKFIPQRPSAEIFSAFSQDRVAFLKSVFSCAQKGKKWFSLDIDGVIAKTGADRQRVVAALNHLEEQGDLVLQVAGARSGYRILRRLSAPELEELTARLVERFTSREGNDIRRIGQIVELINHTGCQTNFLLGYFGEHHDRNCGHCEFCLHAANEHNPPARLAIRTGRSAADWETWKGQIERVLAEKHAALRSQRQQARFFCGIRSPRSSKAGLPRHASFGLLANLPFIEVLEALNTYFPTTVDQ
jgi:ATP-dependent DNA helicase RecQ